MNLPDTRGWLVIGLFALTFFIFAIIAVHLDMTDLRQLFVVLATAVVSGGLGSAVGFYLGSSKGSSDKDATIAAMTPKDGQ